MVQAELQAIKMDLYQIKKELNNYMSTTDLEKDYKYYNKAK